jgi:ribosomal protein S18 acetylase RimI-like enzyme
MTTNETAAHQDEGQMVDIETARRRNEIQMTTVEAVEREEADKLIDIINQSGEGMPNYIWSLLAQAEKGRVSANDIARKRILAEHGPFNFTNYNAIKDGDELVGVCGSYLIQSPHALEDFLLDPDVVWPIPVLQSRARDTWHISAINCTEKRRRKGIASTLLKNAEKMGREHGAKKMTIIVASDNQPAKSLCERFGFEIMEVVPAVEFEGMMHNGEWQLLIKPL